MNAPTMSGPARLRETSVAVVGAGPAGLLLALLLDRYGVPSVVFDAEDAEDAEGTSAHRPYATTHNARTMEHYRRLGIAAPIRRLGLPAEHPTDIACFTRYGGHELTRLRQPGTTELLRQAAAAPRTDQLPEPSHRAHQADVDAFLYEHACSRPNITVRPGWRITALTQNARQVTLHAERPDHPAEDWTARYAVACTGGGSAVRRALGGRRTGPGPRGHRGAARPVTAARLRLPTFHREVCTGERAWSYWAVNPDLVLQLVALNGEDEFCLVADLTAVTVGADPATPAGIADLVRRAAGRPLPVEVIGHRSWTPAAPPATQPFRKGRLLLIGDVAPLPTPTGGFGLNTGADAAANLAWKLAAVLRGWGGPRLLATYESERRPVALRNTAAARELAEGPADIERPPDLEADTASGAAARDRTGHLLRRHAEHIRSPGVQLGARYDGSPIVAPDPEAEPPGDSWGTYTPTSIPGGRAPTCGWTTGTAPAAPCSTASAPGSRCCGWARNRPVPNPCRPPPRHTACR
ncbi:FAD-dependent monooxygenase [Streptomyces noursei]|uniref:FAD-dependent monooxygenase n=1 Tax=Streptomyces noursei TaxID=1971 RepID=UPI0022A7872E|nr:FAD-dependent monooxygenase [Streptomyces noursei]MCZ1018729.1 FAD-dependent monooxygenase [Streptomyces noursei]